MRPNVLLVVADQHRWDCIGSAGRFNIKTPNLDALADEGAFFEHAYTPIPVCAPARQALLSGINPDSYGALWNTNFIKTPTIEPKSSYYTAALHNNGYRCSLIGKWNSSDTHSPNDFGFDDFIGLNDYNRMISERYPNLIYKRKWFGEKNHLPLKDSKTHWLAARACSIIKENERENQPWFIRIDLTDPHLPYRPSEPFASMFSPSDIEPWDSFGDNLKNKPYIQHQQLKNWELEGMTWDDWKECVSFYYGMIAQVDDCVSMIIKELKELSQYDNTIIIYTSDHGDLCGGHGMLDKHYVLYDDVTRVPLIMRYPNKIKKGLRIKEYISSCLDIGITIADLCDISGVEAGHGISLASLLAGENQENRDFAVSSANGQQFGLYSQRSIRTDDWLYVWNMTDIDELYNMKEDIGQKSNLICDDALKAIIARLRRRLYDELNRRDDPFTKTDWLKAQLLENKKLSKIQ